LQLSLQWQFGCRPIPQHKHGEQEPIKQNSSVIGSDAGGVACIETPTAIETMANGVERRSATDVPGMFSNITGEMDAGTSGRSVISLIGPDIVNERSRDRLRLFLTGSRLVQFCQ
jgi:hypothetical protein